LASLTEKRLCLHRDLQKQRRENEALRAQVAELQHIANMGVASYMIAHELNNLLTPVGTYAALALQNPGDAELVEKALHKAERNCQRAAQITESILSLAAGDRQPKQLCKLAPLVAEVFDCLARDFSKDGIDIEITIPDDLEVFAVPVQLQQVLMNLILNAREAMLGSGGTLSISAGLATEMVEVKVRDTGEGIAGPKLADVFEPFFTTKKRGHGSRTGRTAGLGLAFCRKVVEAHNGKISVESRPNNGTTFTIALPKSAPGCVNRA